MKNKLEELPVDFFPSEMHFQGVAVTELGVSSMKA